MSPICIVRNDRVQAVGWPQRRGLPEFPGFRVCTDTFIRSQTTTKTYCRLRIYENPETKSTIYLQHDPACPWLVPFKVTVIGDDRRGLEPQELREIFGAFRKARLLTIELALDFSQSSGVNRKFVLGHCIFGKSRHVRKWRNGGLRFGTRHSATMVRVYFKKEIGAFRIEIELHSTWLRDKEMEIPQDMQKLSNLLLPRRLQFVKIDWDLLSAHLSRKGLPAARLINRVRSKAHSLGQALEYLRHGVGLSNVHRFLRPLRINRPIQEHLKAWADRWRRKP